RIPERTHEAVELPDATVTEEQTKPAGESAPRRPEGSYQEPVCKTEPEDADNDYVAQVMRPHSLRGHILAAHSTATPENRPDELVDSGDYVSFDGLSSYQILSISVGSANVESRYLDAYRVDGADHTEYAEDDATVSYTTEGDVLFDSDEHTLRSDAAAELQAI